MAILELSKSNEPPATVYDPVRRQFVAATPEEVIRQKWLKSMVEERGFPLPLLAVEKELRGLPHLQGEAKTLPRRRIDIVAFAKGIHPLFPLFPLLLIECKAVDLNPRFARQVIGYNGVIGARFIALANQEEFLLGSFDEESGMFKFKEGLPTYQSLLNSYR